MKEFFMSTVAYKKFFSMLLSVVILTNAFSFVSRENTDLFSVDDVYTVSSISKYYNLLSLLPIKIVSEFLSINVCDSNSVGTKQTSNSKHKNSNKNKTTSTTDFAFNISSVTNFVCSYSKFVKYNLFGLTNNLNFSKICCELSMSCIVSMFVFVFSGCMVLARGDTEDNIIINKIENKVVRLV